MSSQRRIYRSYHLTFGTILLLFAVACYALASPVMAAGPSCTVDPAGGTGVDYMTIQAAVNDPGCVDIFVQPGLYTEHITINRDVNLFGADASTAILDGNQVGRVVEVLNASAVISGVTIQNGRSQNFGGGLLNMGHTTVVGSRFFDNVGAEGGGIANIGSLLIVGSEIVHNTATACYSSATGGGGVYTGDEAHTAVNDTLIARNRACAFGGGFYSIGELDVQSSEVAFNTASTQSAGGIYARGVITVTGSHLHDNQALHLGGGLLFLSDGAIDDRLTLQQSEVLSNTANAGGGVYAFSPGGDGARVVVSENQFWNNTADTEGSAVTFDFRWGGVSDVLIDRNYVARNVRTSALYLSGRRIVCTNNIVAHNDVSGIVVGSLSGPAMFVNNTVWGNLGSGIFVGQDLSESQITNNIVAGNGIYGISSGQPVPAIIANDVWNNGLGNYANMDDQTGLNGNLSVNPLLADPNQNNWRLTVTSPLIDAGSSNSAPPVDFYGNPRPFNARWDIGASEFTIFTPCCYVWLPIAQNPPSVAIAQGK